MVLKYDLFDIPTTKSDRSDNKREHYKIKKNLIEWLRDNTNIFHLFEYARYDECLISLSISGSSFYPDVAIFTSDKKQIWIEIETNPLNIFYKFVILSFLHKFKPSNYPDMLIFGILEPSDHIKENFLKTCNEIKKLTKIPVVMIYIVKSKDQIVRMR